MGAIYRKKSRKNKLKKKLNINPAFNYLSRKTDFFKSAKTNIKKNVKRQKKTTNRIKKNARDS